MIDDTQTVTSMLAPLSPFLSVIAVFILELLSRPKKRRGMSALPGWTIAAPPLLFAALAGLTFIIYV